MASILSHRYLDTYSNIYSREIMSLFERISTTGLIVNQRYKRNEVFFKTTPEILSNICILMKLTKNLGVIAISLWTMYLMKIIYMRHSHGYDPPHLPAYVGISRGIEVN